jgi:hypothetical protein
MANKQDNRAGGDIVPPLPKVNSLQALMRLRPKRGNEWCTFAFVLNRDIIKSDGSLDELHAVVFPLGAFDDQLKAEEHAKNIISLTGHPGVISAKYGSPVPLTTKFDPSTVTEVPVDMKGRIIELESSQYKRERDEYEKRVKQERDIMKEAEEETNPDSIEHFKRQCYLAIKNRANFQVHSREADTAWQNYKKREMAVRDHFARHPEHEKDWLPYLKEKLTERGELDLYYGMESAYKEIRDELLGLIDVDDDLSPSSNEPVNISQQSPISTSQQSTLELSQTSTPPETPTSNSSESSTFTPKQSSTSTSSESSTSTLSESSTSTLSESSTSTPKESSTSTQKESSTSTSSETTTSTSSETTTSTTKEFQQLNSRVRIKDNILCECPGGVCLGLKQEECTDDICMYECSGGVCKVTETNKLSADGSENSDSSIRRNNNDSDDIMNNEAEADDIIGPEAVTSNSISKVKFTTENDSTSKLEPIIDEDDSDDVISKTKIIEDDDDLIPADAITDEKESKPSIIENSGYIEESSSDDENLSKPSNPTVNNKNSNINTNNKNGTTSTNKRGKRRSGRR